MEEILYVLNKCGLWPKTTRYLKFRAGILMVPGMLSVTSAVLHMAFLPKSQIAHRRSALLEDASIAASGVGIINILIAFLSKREEIGKLIADLGNFRNFGVPPGMEMTKLKLKFYYRLFYGYTIFGTIFVALLSYFYNGPKCAENNLKHNISDVCGMINPAFTPFNLRNRNIYFTVLSIQVAIYMYYVSTTVTVNYLIFSVAMHLICRIKHLSRETQQIFDGNNVKIQKRRLIYCIKYHIEILRFGERINDCFSQALFAYLCFTAIVCAIVGYQALVDVSLNGTIHLVGWLVSILLMCFAGQYLLDESKSFGDSLFKSKWYKSDVETQKIVAIVLMRSQKGLIMKAGSFGNMSLETFQKVIKTAYSYLTVMKRTM